MKINTYYFQRDVAIVTKKDTKDGNYSAGNETLDDN
jgi:hypothetical protein